MIEKAIYADTLDEAACLAIVNGPGDEFGPISAYDLVELRLDKGIRSRWKRLNTTMIKLLADVREVFPDAQYYTASGGFHLMLGASHDNTVAATSQQELLALHGTANVGDGDF